VNQAEKNNRQVFFIGVTVILLLLAFLYFARRVITPFFVAFALAYFLDPLVDRLEAKKVPRTLATIFLMVVFFGLSFGAVLLIFPLFGMQVENLTSSLPNYIQVVQDWARPVLEQVAGLDPSSIQNVFKEVMAKFGEVPLKILTFLTTFLWDSLTNLFDILLFLANVVLIPVVMFYLLRDFDQINEKLLNMVPQRFRNTVMETIAGIDRVLAGFVRGQLMVAFSMGFLYVVGLFICGTPMSLFIGFLAGFANLIPYLGIVIGFIPAALLTYLQGQEWLPVLGVAGVFAVVQALEGMVITPRLVGDNIGLHPVAVMLAVLLGGEFFGLPGIILGVPAVAVLNVLLARGLIRYKKSDFFTTNSS